VGIPHVLYPNFIVVSPSIRALERVLEWTDQW